MNYSCNICNYHTIRIDNYKRHLYSKKHISNNKTDSFTCKYCEKQYKYRQSLYYHIKYSCNKNIDRTIEDINNIFDKKDKEIYKQKEQIKILQQENNILKRTLCKDLLNYEDTDLSHLNNINIETIIDNIILKLIEYIHFNIEKTKNMNIYISNIRNNHIMIYENNMWIKKNRTIEINNLYNKIIYIIKNRLLYPNHNLVYIFENQLEEEDKIKENIKLLLYNKKII